jgi:hypothetical protein
MSVTICAGAIATLGANLVLGRQRYGQAKFGAMSLYAPDGGRKYLTITLAFAGRTGRIDISGLIHCSRTGVKEGICRPKALVRKT